MMLNLRQKQNGDVTAAIAALQAEREQLEDRRRAILEDSENPTALDRYAGEFQKISLRLAAIPGALDKLTAQQTSADLAALEKQLAEALKQHERALDDARKVVSERTAARLHAAALGRATDHLLPALKSRIAEHASNIDHLAKRLHAAGKLSNQQYEDARLQTFEVVNEGMSIDEYDQRFSELYKRVYGKGVE